MTNHPATEERTACIERSPQAGHPAADAVIRELGELGGVRPAYATSFPLREPPDVPRRRRIDTTVHLS